MFVLVNCVRLSVCVRERERVCVCIGANLSQQIEEVNHKIPEREGVFSSLAHSF